MTDTATAPAADKAGSFVTIDLSQPIERGETTIGQLTLRKPKAGELRGLALGDVINTDITALLTLLPRITEPPLAAHECDALDPADLTEMGGAVRGFFMTAAERALMETMIAEHQPKT